MAAGSASRHPQRLARELAWVMAPSAAAAGFGLFFNLWSATSALSFAGLALVVATPIAIGRRRVVDHLVAFVASCTRRAPTAPPEGKRILEDEDLSVELWRLRRWLAEQESVRAANDVEQNLLLRALPDPFVRINQDDVIDLANRAALARFGNDLVGRKLTTMIRDPELLLAVRTARNNQDGQTLQLDLPGVPSRVFDVEVQPVGSLGVEPKILLVLHERTSELRSVTLRDEFLANASHEIRTPLSAVRGMIETLRTTAKDDPVAQQRFLETMDDEAQRMTRLLDELLLLSRVQLTLHASPDNPVDMADVLGQVVRGITPVAEKQKMGIELSIEEDLPSVLGDPDQLQQVFVNLVDNAIKYGSDGQTIRVQASRVDRAPPQAGRLTGRPALVVEVIDQGEGIPPEAIPRVKERFFRVDKSRSRRRGGTGLGLAIVDGVLNRHQGHLAIQSRLGEGSRFSVFLPLNLPA
ncbi:MAG: ATP-binding protein [Geminicoccaceae bacterium]